MNDQASKGMVDCEKGFVQSERVDGLKDKGSGKDRR